MALALAEAGADVLLVQVCPASPLHSSPTLSPRERERKLRNRRRRSDTNPHHLPLSATRPTKPRTRRSSPSGGGPRSTRRTSPPPARWRRWCRGSCRTGTRSTSW
jgi:hypothetical protein